MAKPAQVEFPGQKKAKVRMRGTKHANEATVKKIKRELLSVNTVVEYFVHRLMNKNY